MNLQDVLANQPYGRVDRTDELVRIVEVCNQRFAEALLKGDERAADFWQAMTRKYETQHALECGIAAAGAMLQYGVSDINGKPYKRNSASRMRGFERFSDVVLETLEEEGFLRKINS